ncbi:MAG TPA: L,D-transpeptidase, partial [Patescibacteria group bacterium]|nr:L,D-transpeptidase [Patescibacteria group bacterium]
RAEIRFFQADGAPVNRESIFPYEEDFRGGVSLATVTHESTDFHQILVMPRQQKQRGDQNRPHKYIEVNLSEQIAYLWENAYLRNVYLISSGLPRTPSPEGEWSVLAKLPVHVYDGRPVYYFPNTKWNLRYKAGGPERNYYLHTAYWHNNFGNPMSHGCINMREADAHFTYDWSEIGTPVWIHQ